MSTLAESERVFATFGLVIYVWRDVLTYMHASTRNETQQGAAIDVQRCCSLLQGRERHGSIDAMLLLLQDMHNFKKDKSKRRPLHILKYFYTCSTNRDKSSANMSRR